MSLELSRALMAAGGGLRREPSRRQHRDRHAPHDRVLVVV